MTADHGSLDRGSLDHSSLDHSAPRTDRLDGNAAVGVLGELFAVDITQARGECGHCGALGLLAEALTELDDEGVIVLCRSCGHTLLTYVHGPRGRHLLLPGLRALSL